MNHVECSGTRCWPDVAALQSQLRRGDKSACVAAAFALVRCGPEALEALSQAARGAAQWEVREAAIRALGCLEGADVVPVLCHALSDRDDRVRLAAADALADVGDERAIGPLSLALRCCFPGRAPLRQAFLAYALSLTGTAAFLTILIWQWQRSSAFFLPFFVGAHLVGAYHRWRRKRSTLVRALTLALTAVAERSPTPELREALPTLKAVQADLLQQEAQTRKASRRAVERIEELTAQVQDLPIPVKPVDGAALPIPGEQGAAEPEVRRAGLG